MRDNSQSSSSSELDDSGEGGGGTGYVTLSNSQLWFGTLSDVRDAEKDGISGLSAMQSLSDLTLPAEDVEVVFVQAAEVPEELQHLWNLRVLVVAADWPAQVLPDMNLPLNLSRSLYSDFSVTTDDLRAIQPYRTLSSSFSLPQWLTTLPRLHVLCAEEIRNMGELSMLGLLKLELSVPVGEKPPLAGIDLPLLQELDLTLTGTTMALGKETWSRVPGVRILSITGDTTPRILALELLSHLTSLTVTARDLRQIGVEDHGLPFLQNLDITSTDLYSLPAGLFQGQHLRRVRLSGMATYFENGFPGIEHASALDELCIESIGDVQMGGVLNIPNECLEGLHSLDLDQFEGHTIPYDRMQALEKLSCSYSRLPLTNDLYWLHNLRELHLSGPVSLPDNLGDLTRLEVFRCTSDTIRELPESMANLVDLRALELYLPKATSLPNLANMIRLETLDVAACSLKKLPRGLDHLVALQELTFCSSVLEDSLPASVLELRNLTAVSVGRVEDSHWFV